MKYRIKNLYITHGKRKNVKARAKRNKALYLQILPPIARARGEKINVNALFEIALLPEAKKPPFPSRVLTRLRGILRRLSKALARTADSLKARLAAQPARPLHLKFYSGALCAAVAVALSSASIVLLGLFWSFMRPYDSLVIPKLTGEVFNSAEQAHEEKINFLVSYENSETTPAGQIISQTPSAGVTRRIYLGGKKPTVTVKVSLGRSFYTVESFVGEDARQALLALRNAHVPINQIYEYSDTVPSGSVISTSPKAGERLFEGETIAVTVSLGKFVPTVKVPDLYGLSESQARSLLESRSLRVATVTYAVSSSAIGTVIAQDVLPYTSVSEDTAVSFTVSLGNATPQKYVPDLHGLTVEEATQRLREVGLVVGGIFTVSSASPNGTVVTQGFAAGTPITSSITSIDIYISS